MPGRRGETGLGEEAGPGVQAGVVLPQRGDWEGEKGIQQVMLLMEGEGSRKGVRDGSSIRDDICWMSEYVLSTCVPIARDRARTRETLALVELTS